MSKTIAFETELTGGPTLSIPPEIAAALPSKGKVTSNYILVETIALLQHRLGLEAV